MNLIRPALFAVSLSLCASAWAQSELARDRYRSDTPLDFFGALDFGLRREDNGTQARSVVQSGGLLANRLGVRAQQTLGGDAKAALHIEAGIAQSGTEWLAFTRRATASLLGGYGELRLGLDWSPTYVLAFEFDPFRANGVAAGASLSAIGLRNAGTGNFSASPFATNQSTGSGASVARDPFAVHTNAGAAYLFEVANGAYGHFVVQPGRAEGENSAANRASGSVKGDGEVAALRAGWDMTDGRRRLHFAAAFGLTHYAAGDWQTFNLGALARQETLSLMLFWQQQELPSALAQSAVQDWGAGLQWKAAELHQWRASLGAKSAGNDRGARRWGVGYVYGGTNAARLYLTYARIDNDAAAAYAFPGSAAPPEANGKSTNALEGGLALTF